MLTPKEVTGILRAKGFKVTPQRLAVYHVLSHTTEHPTAETLYRQLEPFYPTMSLATVYKALSILCEVGLAQELNVGEDSFRFDANITHHPHVRCTVCGRVDDVMGIASDAIEHEAAEATGYRMTDRQLYFFGVCPECQRVAREQAEADTAAEEPMTLIDRIAQ